MKSFFGKSLFNFVGGYTECPGRSMQNYAEVCGTIVPPKSNKAEVPHSSTTSAQFCILPQNYSSMRTLYLQSISVRILHELLGLQPFHMLSLLGDQDCHHSGDEPGRCLFIDLAILYYMY